jgi:hypothetical protein
MNDREVVRTLLAAVAMHALISSDPRRYTTDMCAQAAVAFADALLEALEVKPT